MESAFPNMCKTLEARSHKTAPGIRSLCPTLSPQFFEADEKGTEGPFLLSFGLQDRIAPTSTTERKTPDISSARQTYSRLTINSNHRSCTARDAREHWSFEPDVRTESDTTRCN
ncbi:hypothetical protein QLX08_005915 [Tetragonisca angustula]|uniref:Uncharacterized protein n=1 Tax=Tetragonisca angustula TaxID=166442 RepID=A0AAW0ZYD4_9HYME